MKNLSIFQIVLVSIFVVLLVVAVIIFSLERPGVGGRGGQTTLVLWGEWLDSRLASFIDNFNNQSSNQPYRLEYIGFNPGTLARELVEALASGRGPDLVLLPHEEIFRQAERLLIIPYESYPRPSYEEQFADIARLWLTAEGVLALPVGVDPLVLYYNRDQLAAAGLARPPATWTEFVSAARRFFDGDERDNVFRSAVALGDTGNIPHAKDILSTLLLQLGDPVYAFRDGAWRTVFKDNPGFPTTPAFSAFNFFAQFADPARATYSWNAVMPEASEAFSRGQTAFYLGLASEYNGLRARNPHLNFDVASMPQRLPSESFTFGRLYGLGVIKNGANLPAAFSAATLLATAPQVESLVTALGIVPVRRDLLAASAASDPAEDTFFRSALVARAWYDFAPEETAAIFRRVVGAAKTGEQTLTGAINQAHNDLERLLPK